MIPVVFSLVSSFGTAEPGALQCTWFTLVFFDHHVTHVTPLVCSQPAALAFLRPPAVPRTRRVSTPALAFLRPLAVSRTRRGPGSTQFRDIVLGIYT